MIKGRWQHWLSWVYLGAFQSLRRCCTRLQAFREDRTLIAAADYIAEALGQRFVESVPLNMERAWAESHRKCPLICLLSPGADPTKLIEVGPGIIAHVIQMSGVALLHSCSISASRQTQS